MNRNFVFLNSTFSTKLLTSITICSIISYFSH
jgi:hypothetical protein